MGLLEKVAGRGAISRWARGNLSAKDVRRIIGGKGLSELKDAAESLSTGWRGARELKSGGHRDYLFERAIDKMKNPGKAKLTSMARGIASANRSLLMKPPSSLRARLKDYAEVKKAKDTMLGGGFDGL